jgi:hypothetical protein
MHCRSQGSLRYSERDDRFWLVVDVDPEIVEFARSLVPKAIRLNRQRYDPHITVIRNERPVNMAAWRAHEGEVICFDYSPVVFNDELYYWLGASCQRLQEIRVELGLPEFSEFTRPPDMADLFHITIGNRKP